MPIPTFSLRFDEHQLLELAARARIHGSRRGYLHKADSKLKKLQLRWCCVYQNFLFYFESESCTKPLGVVFLEGTVCRSVEQLGMPIRDVEGAFRISGDSTVPGNSTSKHFVFLASSDKEREEWISCITHANMTKLLQDLEEFRIRCESLEGKLATSMREVEHLRQAQHRAHEDITHLRATVNSSPKNSPRHARGSLGSSSLPPSPTGSVEFNVQRLQGYVRSWLIRRRWKRVVHEYMSSAASEGTKRRNQLIWKFIASEEDYVSQLTVLSEEFNQQFHISSSAQKPPITLQQCSSIFRNCDELLLFHQLFLKGLRSRIDKWPVVLFGDVLKLFIPQFTLYHKFVGNHSHALDLLTSLRSQSPFSQLLSGVQARPGCKGFGLEELLQVPLKRIGSLIQELEDLRVTTPPDHVDCCALSDAVTELEGIQKMVMDEVSMSEVVRAVLRVERSIEGGCSELLDKEQTLVKEGVLHQVVDKPTSTLLRGANAMYTRSATTLGRTLAAKLRITTRHCFLFSKHLIITTRVQKKPHDIYRLAKDHGVLPLAKCHIYEHHSEENPDLHYRGIRVVYSPGEEKETIVLLANSTSDKAQWMADLSQYIETEKQNKVLECQSQGAPVELSNRFIRYNTLKTGKEQLVNCGTLDCLLQRLVKINYFGVDFFNTFFMTFPLFTDAHTVLDALSRSYYEAISSRGQRRPSFCPDDFVRDALAQKTNHKRRKNSSPSASLTVSCSPTLGSYSHQRSFSSSASSSSSTSSTTTSTTQPAPSPSSPPDAPSNANLSSIFLALKHWICKHFYHFAEDPSLAEGLENLLSHALSCPSLLPHEISSALEAQRLFLLQRDAEDEYSEVVELIHSCAHLPPKPFEVVLLWEAREVAEQLCLIESTLFGRIVTSEIMRHLMAKGEQKQKAAPHLAAIFSHFNRMSLFFMWTVASQRYAIDRTKVIELLIMTAGECLQLNNFSSFMQLMSALEHGSVNRFKNAWEDVSKIAKQQFRGYKRFSNTEGRFKELREVTKKATPPSIPYLGIALSELTGVVEAVSTHVNGGLINFIKMRKCTRLISDVLLHQRDPYEYPLTPEISKVLLCTPIPGNEDELYRYVDSIEDK